MTESSLNGDINQAIRFLNAFRTKSLNDVMKLIHDAYDKVYNADNDEYEFIKKTTKDMIDDVNDIMKIEDREYKLFKESMTNIIAHKDDPDVIHVIRQFSYIQQDIKDIWKHEFKRFVDKVARERDEARSADEHVKHLAYIHILGKLEHVEDVIIHIHKRLNNLTHLKKEDDPTK